MNREHLVPATNKNKLASSLMTTIPVYEQLLEQTPVGLTFPSFPHINKKVDRTQNVAPSWGVPNGWGRAKKKIPNSLLCTVERLMRVIRNFEAKCSLNVNGTGAPRPWRDATVTLRDCVIIHKFFLSMAWHMPSYWCTPSHVASLEGSLEDGLKPSTSAVCL